MLSPLKTAPQDHAMSDAKQTVTIKKYANRRLYNTATSSYVTLDNLSQMVKEGIEFNVYDAKTSEDITRSVLTQIIVEEESKAGQNLLPINFLRQLISFYGDNMQWLVPKYLEHSMETLAKNQEQLRGYLQTAFGGMFPFGSTFEEMGKQNLAMFERAMKMFSPFGMAAGGMGTNAATESSRSESNAPAEAEERAEKAAEAAFTPSNVMNMPTPATTQASGGSQASNEEVQQKIAALQRQLADLAKNKA
jgi:polyhydroxyalkanoate synthesis repressor PhaR